MVKPSSTALLELLVLSTTSIQGLFLLSRARASHTLLLVQDGARKLSPSAYGWRWRDEAFNIDYIVEVQDLFEVQWLEGSSRDYHCATINEEQFIVLACYVLRPELVFEALVP